MVIGKNGNELKEGGRLPDRGTIPPFAWRNRETSRRTSASMSFAVIGLLAGSLCIARNRRYYVVLRSG